MTSVHIIKDGNKWKVKRFNTDSKIDILNRALKVEHYREFAFLYACQHAKDGETIYMHNEDGSVQYTFEIDDNI